MSPLLIHLSLALSKLQVDPCRESRPSVGLEALARWANFAAVLPPCTPVPASARRSVDFLYALLGQGVSDGFLVHQSNIASLQTRLVPFVGHPELVMAALDIITATLRETEGAEECLTPEVARGLRRLAAHFA